MMMMAVVGADDGEKETITFKLFQVSDQNYYKLHASDDRFSVYYTSNGCVTRRRKSKGTDIIHYKINYQIVTVYREEEKDLLRLQFVSLFWLPEW